MIPISMQVLTSDGCTHCHNFLSFWSNEAERWPQVSMKELNVLTKEGQALVVQHGIFGLPGVVLGDQLFSTGEVPKERLIAHLARLEDLSQA